MEIAALILSIISIISSLVIAIYEIVENRKINKISLESEYFDSLFKDFLLKKIPSTRIKIQFNSEGKLIDTEEFVSVLNEIRKDSLYFIYTDKDFYNELKYSLQDLENYILNEENNELIGEDQTTFFNNVQEKITTIYDIMISKYSGTKPKKK